MINLKKHYKKYLAEIFMAVAITGLAVGMPGISKAYATEDYYVLKAGDKEVATFASESEAKQVIDKVKNYYVLEGAKDVATKVDPELTVGHKIVGVGESPKSAKSVDDVVNTIVSGDKVRTEYTIEDGDTFWSVAVGQGVTVEEILSLNDATEETVIKPGDTIYLDAFEPLVNVTTTQTVTGDEVIPFETTYEDDDSMYEDEEEVVTEGENGLQTVTKSLTTVNGKNTAVQVLKSEVKSEAVTQVIKRGTKERKSANSSTSSSSRSSARATYNGDGYSIGGGSILGAAMSQIGRDQDCTALVSNSLAAAGIYFYGWPEDYAALGSWTSSPSPGDIVIYSGHVAIYAGNGQAVHGGWNGYGTVLSSVSCNNPLIGYIHVG